MDLGGRAVLITGGKRIGGAVASAFAAGGADVALSYNRSRSDAEQAAAAVEAEGRRAVVTQADLSLPDHCARLVNGSAETLGRLDILVNMASVYARTAFDELTEQDWDRGLAVDLTASFLCARAAVPHMRARAGGRIVNFADWVAASGRPRYPGFLAILRRQARGRRADRGACARTGGRPDSRQRHRARAHSSAE